jgi:DMSO/TMAO reductase YedYZ heme-binding membrane subunit
MYMAAPLAVIHLLWLSKDSTPEEAIYLLVLLLLLAERGLFEWQKRKAIR